MSPDTLKKQFSEVFNLYAAEGIATFAAQNAGAVAELSHVCFKFSSQAAYADYVAAAREIGTVTQEEFKGKQITWCRLNAPLKKDGLTLEWLEMVEPKLEQHPTNGVANLGYCVPALETAVKLPSADTAMTFRYQSAHAVQLAPKP